MDVSEVDISERKDFNTFIVKSTLYSLKIDGDKIRRSKAVEVASDETEYERYKDHMKTLRQDVLLSPSKRKNPPPHGFKSAFDRLNTLDPKKKLFCACGDFYLVKKSFTEGVQHVEQGEIHTYKAIGRPLDIFKSNEYLEPQTFKSSYDRCTKPERISPGETKIIPSNTYYIVIAPCHTFFIKEIKKVSEAENSTQMSSLFANEADEHVTRNGFNESGRMLPQPSGSRDEENDNSRSSMEFLTFEEALNSTGSKRSSTGSDRRQAKRAKSSTPGPTTTMAIREVNSNLPSPNSLRNQMELLSNDGANNEDSGRAVFAIRKDSKIESYYLRSDSTFRILQDNVMDGSFTIENEDMDPCVIEYHGEVQFIKEIARFKNGSTFETTLTVQKDLVNELSDSTRKKEKVVVNYFFEYAFKTIEAAYKKFLDMRNTQMIGSCVPAIVPLSDARFFGPVSDAYEAKP